MKAFIRKNRMVVSNFLTFADNSGIISVTKKEFLIILRRKEPMARSPRGHFTFYFLYHSDRAYFTVLLNKLSEEQAGKIRESNHISQQIFVSQPYLRLKVDTHMAASTIYSLIMNIKNKDMLPHNHMETFDFMVGHLIGSLYE